MACEMSRDDWGQISLRPHVSGQGRRIALRRILRLICYIVMLRFALHTIARYQAIVHGTKHAITLRFSCSSDSAVLHAMCTMILVCIVSPLATDMFAPLGLLFGDRVQLLETFNHPILSSSIRDFFAHRWNLPAHRIMTRCIYIPLGGRKRPFTSAMACAVLMVPT